MPTYEATARESAPHTPQATLRDVNRRAAVLLGVLICLMAACSPDSVSTQGELGSVPDAITPVPTAAIDDLATGETAALEPTPTPEPTAEPEGPEPLIVLTVLGETGVVGPLDRPALAGVLSAVARINDDGGLLGRPIEVRRLNTDSRSSVVERYAGRLANVMPDVVITSCDVDLARPVLEEADTLGLLTISPCASDAGYVTGGFGSRNFTMGAVYEVQGELAARLALERYGATSLVLRDVTSPEATRFCDGFERAFRELGGSVTYRDEFNYDTLEPVQDRLEGRAGQAAFITLCSHVPGGKDAAPSIVEMLRSLGYQAPIVSGSTLDEITWFNDVPALGELLFVSWSSVFGNDPDERVNDLVRRAQQLPDTPGVGMTTVLGADAIEAWARAVEAARDVAPARVASALGSFNNESLSTGEVSFTAGSRMDLGRVFRVMRVFDGELTVLALEETPD